MGKSTVILCVLIACFANATFAQSYSEGNLPWKDNQLQWSDFRAAYPSNDTLTYEAIYFATSKLNEVKIDGVKYQYLDYDTYLNRGMSWVSENSKTPTMLKLCQTDFDLWELTARKVVYDYYMGADTDIDNVFAYYKELWTRRQNEEYKKSVYGKSAEEVDRYAEEVARELDAMQFHPDVCVQNSKVADGCYYDMGLTYYIPFREYVSPFYGFELDFGFYYKKSLFALDLGLGAFSKCKKAISGKKGVIEEGDDVFSCNMNFIYGYNVPRNRKTELTPYVGVGFKTFNGGEMYQEYLTKYDKGRNYEKVGFSIGIGLMADLIVSKTYSLISCNECRVTNRAIRLKPYFSMTRYSGDLGWVPSLNLSINFDSSAYSLLKK